MNKVVNTMMFLAILFAVCGVCLSGCATPPAETAVSTISVSGTTGFVFQPHKTIPRDNSNRDDYYSLTTDPPPTISQEMLDQVSAGMHIGEIVDVLGHGVDITSGVMSGVYSLPDGRWVYVWYDSDYYCTSIMVEDYK